MHVFSWVWVFFFASQANTRSASWEWMNVDFSGLMRTERGHGLTLFATVGFFYCPLAPPTGTASRLSRVRIESAVVIDPNEGRGLLHNYPFTLL